MKIYAFRQEQFIQKPIETVFAFFADAANLESITPPWLRFRIHTPTPIEMGPGTLIRYGLRWRGVPLHWTTEICEWQPSSRFVDRQVKGPYQHWCHTHLFERTSSGTKMTDIVEYALPLGLFGRLAHVAVVRRDVEAIFAYRQKCIAKGLADQEPLLRIRNPVVSSVEQAYM